MAERTAAGEARLTALASIDASLNVLRDRRSLSSYLIMVHGLRSHLARLEKALEELPIDAIEEITPRICDLSVKMDELEDAIRKSDQDIEEQWRESNGRALMCRYCGADRDLDELHASDCEFGHYESALRPSAS